MSRSRVVLIGLCVVALGATLLVVRAKTRPEGDAETDRVARVVAEAVSWPRQKTAAGLLNAVLSTRAAQFGGLSVIRAQDLDAADVTDPLAVLTLRIHRDGGYSYFGGYVEPTDACYRAEFTYYGSYETPPERITCPADLTPLPAVAVPQTPSAPRNSMPYGAVRGTPEP